MCAMAHFMYLLTAQLGAIQHSTARGNSTRVITEAMALLYFAPGVTFRNTRSTQGRSRAETAPVRVIDRGCGRRGRNDND